MDKQERPYTYQEREDLADLVKTELQLLSLKIGEKWPHVPPLEIHFTVVEQSAKLAGIKRGIN